jgi:hypothetical protein
MLCLRFPTISEATKGHIRSDWKALPDVPTYYRGVGASGKKIGREEVVIGCYNEFSGAIQWQGSG